MSRSTTAIVGYGRTPFTRVKGDEPILNADEYMAWAAELALESAGMNIADFEGQGLAIAHSEGSHTVNWAAATAENLGVSPRVLLRGDQGGATAAALLVRAAAMIEAGVVDRVLVLGADTPVTNPSVAPGLPLSPERTRGVFWDFQGPFGVMGANAQFALVQTRYMHEHGLKVEDLAKIAVTARYHASLNPDAIYRSAMTEEDYLQSRVLTWPVRLYDCVPLVNGGLAYIVTSAATARQLGTTPVYVRGFGEINNYYHGSRMQPDITRTGFIRTSVEAFEMAGVTHADIDVFQPYDDYPMVVMLQFEDYGFCKVGQGAGFVADTDISIHGSLPILTDGGQLSGGQPGGAIGGFMPLVEGVAQLQDQAGARQVPGAGVALVSGFGGMTYARNNRSCVSIVLGTEA